MGAVIGIDLGTTNTVVAAMRDGRAAALPDESGSTLIPSIVSFLPSGAVLVGSTARERRSEDVRNTIYSVKRLIGRTWDSPEVTQAKARFPFELREGPGRATFVIARGETYTLPEISAFVLRKAKSIAELELGEAVDRAVITVPANFNDLQRAATKVAARVAGLEVLRIINEPTAAALAFGHTPGETKLLAVYDFGGGTFDFTLLRLTEEVFEVLATAGNTFLGGDDIDLEIVERIADRFVVEEHSDPRETPDGLERLRATAEQLKTVLTTEPDASVRLDTLGIPNGPDVGFLLTRRDLDSITRPVLEKTFAVCREALATAKLSPKDINDVLLVGGSTKDPYLRKRVSEFFGRPARHDVDPHEVVALGAAQQAALLAREPTEVSAIAVPPPPPRAPLSSSSDEFTEGDFRQKTRPFGRAPAETGSRPLPVARDIPHRDRRTTGLGLGPAKAPIPDGLPLVGQGILEPVIPQPSAASAPDAHPPSTLEGLGLKAQARVGVGAPMDTALPATKPVAPREFPRGPTVRVSGGTNTEPLAVPHITQPVRADGAPLTTALTSPKRGDTQPFDTSLSLSPIAKTNSRELSPSTPTTDLPATLETTADLTPLPALAASKPTRPQPSFPRAATSPQPSLPRAATPPLNTVPLPLAPALPATVERGPVNARSSDVELDLTLPSTEGLELPELKPSSHPSTRAKRPASLNEEEIRARYGNLPLIVGGKRVGAASTLARVESQPDASAPPRENAALPSVPANIRDAELPATARSALGRETTQVSPQETTKKSLTPLSFTLPPLEPLALEPEELTLPSSRPAPGRYQSSHPAARPNLAIEAELPLPDLPPAFASSTDEPTPRSSRTPRASTQPSVVHAEPPRQPPPPRGTSSVSLDRTLPLVSAASPLTESTSSPLGAPPPPAHRVPPAVPFAPLVSSPVAQSNIPGRRSAPNASAPFKTTAAMPTAPSPIESSPFASSGAIGGALASSLNVSPSRRPPGPALLIDVTPLSLCVETAGGYADILVDRNTPVPCERTREFVTIRDNQESVVVRVAQGDSQRFQENVLLGEVQLSKLSSVPRGQVRIAVTFGLDSDGMLHVRALDVTTGQSALAELQLVAAPTSPEIRQMIARQKTKGTLGTIA